MALQIKRLFQRASIMLVLLLNSETFAETVETAWDLGIGATGIHLPVYPGSSENTSYLIPFPYIYIKTEYLEVDEGIRGFIYQSPRLRLNLSADFGVPVDNDEASLRDGMPDLNTVLQLGPMLEVVLDGGRNQPFESRLEFPARIAVATDIDHTENLGWIFELRYSYEKMRPRKNGWAYLLSAGLRYGSREYHSYYYDVDAAYATPTRPEFSADSGYNGAFIDVNGGYRQDNVIYGLFARYQNINGTAYEDSSLVEQNSYFSFGAGIIWRFAGS